MSTFLDRIEWRCNALPRPWCWLARALFGVACLASVIALSAAVIIPLLLSLQLIGALFGVGLALAIIIGIVFLADRHG